MNAARLLGGSLVWIAAATLGASAGQAQSSPIGKGSWIIDGSASVNSSHDNESDRTTTSAFLSPSALVFVRQRLAIGGSVSLGYVSTDNASSTSFGIGPNVRYYFGDAAGKTFPFLSGTFGAAWTSSDTKNSSTNVSGQSTFVEGAVGITHLVATHVGITGEAFYRHLSSSNDFGPNHASSSSYDVGLRLGITAFLY